LQPIQDLLLGKGPDTRSLVGHRIEQAVNAVLAAKGWTQVTKGGNVAIVAIEMTQNEQTLDTFYNGFGRGWRWGGGLGDATTTVDTYKIRTLDKKRSNPPDTQA
jgi:hypothetical protein